MRAMAKTRRIYARDLGSRHEQSVKWLLAKRKTRAKQTGAGMLGLGVTARFTLAPALARLSENPSFVKGVTVIAASAVGAGIVALGHSKEIREATRLVGRGLYEEASKNRGLIDFLRNYRYVLVDRKGNVRGTNRGRLLGIGRLRLESKRILEDGY